MKLSPHFTVCRSETDAVLVPIGGSAFSGVIRGNATFGEILELLERETTPEAMLSALTERYDAPKELLARDIDRAITQLRAIGALEE